MTKQNVSRETLRWRWITDRGLHIESGDSTLEMYRRLAAAGLPEIAELVPADGSLLIILKPGAPVPATLGDLPKDSPSRGTGLQANRKHEVRVTWNGPDLPAVAERLGLGIAALTAGLADIPFRVKFLGFQPGFAYLEGLPESWHLPRLATPRKQVPAGSVAMGGAYCGIYPAAGPGGWHLIGRTDEVLFDPGARPPARFQPGDVVRLRPA